MTTDAALFPEYATAYSRNARTQRDGLSPEARVHLIAVEDLLAEDPLGHASRLIQLDEDLFIYRHPSPPIEVTFKVDRDGKKVFILHLVVPEFKPPRSVFISYSHEDEPWLLELKKWLAPLEKQDLITIWDDKELKAGEEWREAIEAALADARAAVLLLSIDFLNSEFINEHELPALLRAAEERDLKIFWIAVRHCVIEDTHLARFQAVHKEPPLATIERAADREAHYLNIYKRIKEVVDA